MGTKKSRMVGEPEQLSRRLLALVEAEVESVGRGGMSAIAAKTGIPQPVLQRWLAGKRGISLETADKLAAYYGAVLVVRKGKAKK